MRIEIQKYPDSGLRFDAAPAGPGEPSLADAGVRFDPARDCRAIDSSTGELTLHVVPSTDGASRLPAYIKAHCLPSGTDLSGVDDTNLAVLEPLATGMLETPVAGPNYLAIGDLDRERYALVLEVGFED